MSAPHPDRLVTDSNVEELERYRYHIRKPITRELST